MAAQRPVKAPLDLGLVLEVELLEHALAKLARRGRRVDAGKRGAQWAGEQLEQARSWRTERRARDAGP